MTFAAGVAVGFFAGAATYALVAFVTLMQSVGAWRWPRVRWRRDRWRW